MYLSNLEPGKSAYVTEIIADTDIKNRLESFGLIENTHVTCTQKSPLGEPRAYLIRGAVIALRPEISSCVRCKKCL